MKCATLKFLRKKTPVPCKHYSLNHQLIKSCSMQNNLGILVSDNLKWSPHINNFVAKANKMLGVLRRNCFHLATFYTCLWYVLSCRSVVKSGLHKARLLIWYSTLPYKVHSPGLYIFLCCLFKKLRREQKFYSLPRR